MTRAAVVQRILAECDAAFPGADAFERATVDDVDRLREAIEDALADLREQIDTEGIA
ncbi:MAG TPA: hypothetical protein VKR23_16050 [Gaiellaceae bacterium]|nr:hypothetical protein [Gaiellaceae bacterium]